MIPMMNIIAWGNVVPWAEQRQVEQDLIISRAHRRPLHRSVPARAAPVSRRHGAEQAAFPDAHPLLGRHRSGRTTAGPIGPILDRMRERLEPWLGRANFEQSQVAPKLRFRAQAEDPAAPAQIRLKVEINTAETASLRRAASHPVPGR